jgi:plasmid stability protein
MEAEAREILTAACRRPETKVTAEALRSFVDGIYGDRRPTGVVEDLLEERRREAASE